MTGWPPKIVHWKESAARAVYVFIGADLAQREFGPEIGRDVEEWKNVAKRLAQMLVVVALVAGCGKSVPVISSPADGQTITLDPNRPGTCFQITLADVDYQNTTIEVRGAEQLGGQLSCTPGNYSPAQCCQVGGQFGGGFGQSCVQGRPCPLVFIARRGDMLDVKTANIILQSGGAVPPR